MERVEGGGRIGWVGSWLRVGRVVFGTVEDSRDELTEASAR